MTDEIDEIFEMAKPKKIKKAPKTVKSEKTKEEKFDVRGTKTTRKYTSEGYPIFTTEELNLNDEGGDTELCPFDCDCCT